MGIFAGIGQARAKSDGNYCSPGNYVVKIVRVKQDVNRQKSVIVVVEMQVLHVISKDEKFPAHSVGEDISRVFSTTGPTAEYFLPEVKAFAAAALGCSPDEIDEATMEEICGKSQPLAGTVMELHNRNHVTQQGKDRTRITFKRQIRPSAIFNKSVADGGVLTDQEIARFFTPAQRAAMLAAEAAEDATLKAAAA